MESANSPRSQPGGDKQNEQAGPFEELRQMQLHPAVVNQETQHDGRAKPEHCADRRFDADILLEGRQQEKHRFQTFTRYRKKHHRDQCPALTAAGIQRMINRPFQMHFDRTRHFAHPEHHISQDAHRNDGDDTFKQLLLFLWKLTGRGIDEKTERQTECGSDENANPDHTEPLPALRPFEIAGNQADDQCSFQPFAKHNEKRNEHDELPSPEF
ncbi:hypothetical protein SRABI106_03662 [Rahnella aquatilis]|nr:hypothetical protein SRABI106_03662 [Rahnella aquatilis]